MCLTMLDRTFAGKGKTVYHGWKLFTRNPYGPNYKWGLRFQFAPLHRMYNVSTGEWLKAEKKLIRADRGGIYLTGFHIFRKRPPYKNGSSPSLVLVKVKYRRILAQGNQHNSPIDVAEEMWVPKQRRKK